MCHTVCELSNVTTNLFGKRQVQSLFQLSRHVSKTLSLVYSMKFLKEKRKNVESHYYSLVNLFFLFIFFEEINVKMKKLGKRNKELLE